MSDLPDAPRRILSTVEEICRFGPRLPGSEAEQACRQLILDHLDKLGSGSAAVESFDLLNWTPITGELAITPGDAAVPVQQLGYSASATVEGQLAYCGGGTKDECRRARDRIALCSSEPEMSPGYLHRIEKYRNAVEAGAHAFILVGEAGHPAPFGIIRKRRCGAIPAVSVGYQAGRELLEREGTQHAARLKVLNKVVQDSSANVVWQLGRSDPATVFCAHYDSWTEGAWDNASGVAALLELALWLESQDLKRNVILCFSSGEELGLFGSMDFCARHAEQLSLAVNVDGVGYGGAELQARCSDPGLAKIPPLKGVFSQLPLTPWGDHWSFHRARVRTIFLTCGGPTPVQHTIEDKPDRLNPPDLEASLDLLRRIVAYSGSIR